MIGRDILERIAKCLDGTDDSLIKVLDTMDIGADAWAVESALEKELGFGYCQ